MVASHIHPTVHYTESKRVHARDVNLESTVYHMELLGVPVLVTPGRVQFDHAEQRDLLFVTVYLVQSSSSVAPIGVCEFPMKQRSHMLTADGTAVHFERCESPLLFSFVTRDFLWSMRKVPASTSSSATLPSSSSFIQYEKGSGYYQVGDAVRHVFEQTLGAVLPPVLKEEQRSDASRIRAAFVEGAPQEGWINVFFRNTLFQTVPNEGGGSSDTWLATLRDAFSSVGHQTTVPKLRALLADQVTVSLLDEWRDMYQHLHRTWLQESHAVKHWHDTHQALKHQFVQSVQTIQKSALIKQATQVQHAHRDAQVACSLTAKLLKEWKYMKSIDTVEQLRTAVRKGHGWVPWMVETLERVLETKCVFLHAAAYYQHDWKHVVQSGPGWSMLQRFVPRFYLIVEVNHDAFRLVRYKTKQLFLFRELPWDVRRILCDKIAEEQGGGFACIPECIAWKEQQDQAQESAQKGGRGRRRVPAVADQAEEEDDDDNLKWLGMYAEDVVLLFHHKSLPDVFPGRGPGERLLTAAKVIDMKPLALHSGWRQRLSSFWVQPFALDQHYWASVEHYVQANKFHKHNPAFYLQFTVESGSPLSKDPSMAKVAGSRSGTWNQSPPMRPPEVTIDPDYLVHRYLPCLQKALYAKFTQHADLRALLVATKDAKLLQYRLGKPPLLCVELMKLRYRLMHP